jgi:hypothetical protein
MQAYRKDTIVKQTNNVNAIDTKSLADHWEGIAAAVKRAVQFGHPVMAEIREQFAQ